MSKVLVIATGSVAIVKTLDLVKLLSKKHEVSVIATPYVRQNFHDYVKLQAFEENPSLKVYPEHITFAKEADLIVVVPVSANTLAKFAAGISDNFVTNVLLAARSKIIFAPAMNTYMYEAIKTRGVLEKIASLGHMFIGPTVGMLREGEEGMGRMSEPEDIALCVNNYLSSSKGKKILVPYGASKIWIDPVRYITNNSSGTMGRLLINELRLAGFEVKGIDISNYTNVQFLELAKNEEFDIYISPAAFADYNTSFNAEKIHKGQINHIELSPNVDLLEELTKHFPKRKFYGFKLDNDIQKAKDKLQRLNLAGIIWNRIETMGSPNSTGAFLLKERSIEINNLSKSELAKLIAKEISK